MGLADITVAEAQARRRRRKPPPVIDAVTALANAVTAANTAAQTAAAPRRTRPRSTEPSPAVQEVVAQIAARLARPERTTAQLLTEAIHRVAQAEPAPDSKQERHDTYGPSIPSVLAAILQGPDEVKKAAAEAQRAQDAQLAQAAQAQKAASRRVSQRQKAEKVAPWMDTVEDVLGMAAGAQRRVAEIQRNAKTEGRGRAHELRVMGQLGKRLSSGRETYTRRFHPGDIYAVNPDNPRYDDLVGPGDYALAIASALPFLRPAAAAAEAGGAAAESVGLLGRAAAAAGTAARAATPQVVQRALAGAGAAVRGSAAAEAAVSARAALAAAAARAAARPGVAAAARVGGTVGRTAGRPVSFGLRHPFKAPLYAQAPVALAGGPGLDKALSGEGVFAQGLSTLGNAVAPGGIAGNIVRDAFALPSAVLPSVYLPLAGIVEASQGDSDRLDQLWSDYKDIGLFPAVFSGDPDKVLDAIKEHPLFSALEASGGYALAGRSAGAVLRGLGRSTERDPLTVYGQGEGAVQVPRSYSKNLITEGFQRALEDRARRQGRDPNRADARLAEKILTGKSGKVPVLEGHRNIPIGLIHRFMDAREKIRRENRSEVNKTFLEKAPDKGAGVVSEAVQGSLRSPETWTEDLTSRLEGLKAEDAAGNLTSAERKLNHELQASIEEALKIDDPVAIHEVFDAADEFYIAHAPLIEKLIEKGVLDPAQAERAIRMVYAKRHMGATRGRSEQTQAAIDALKEEIKNAPQGQRVGLVSKLGALQRKRELIDSEGKIITTERIREHMEEAGIDASFLTHQPGVTGSGSHYRAAIRRPRAASKTRGGESFDRGAYESGFTALAAQLRQSRTIVDQAETIDAFGRRFGTGPGDGRPFFGDWDEATLVASELANNPELAAAAGIPEGLKMVPMRIDNVGAKKAELESIDANAAPESTGLLDALGSNPDLAPRRIQELTDEAFQPGPGRVVLVPEVVKREFLNHQKPADEAMRAFQSANQQFKTTVLPGSSKWVLGNAAELDLRQFVNGVLPFPLTFLDPRYHLARRLLKAQREANPEAAAEFRAQTTGTAFTGEEMLQIHQGGNRIADALERFRSTPGPGTLLRMYEAYSRWMFKTQEAMERVGTTAGVGKEAMRQLRESNRSVREAITLQGKALEEFAEGSLHTPNQLRFAHSLEDMFGRWKANSPEVRKTLLQFAPFWMWTRAATRFVGLTLPVKHPIKTGILAATAEMTEEERKKLGLDTLADRPLPANLQGSLPTPSGGILPTQYYSSFGVFSNYPDTLGSTILPQFSGAIANLAGLDWKGDKLRNEDGSQTSTQQNAGIAGYSLLEAFIPGLAIARRIQEGGGSPAAGSTAFSPKTSDSNPSDGLFSGLGHVFVPQTLPAGLVEYLRDKSHSQEITVPIDGADDSPITPAAPSSGEATAPWMTDGPATSGATAPWMVP